MYVLSKVTFSVYCAMRGVKVKVLLYNGDGTTLSFLIHTL